MRRVREAPELIPGFLEEVLRYNGPVKVLTRRATEDVTPSGITIPRGAVVAALVAAANRDPEVFPEPDTANLSGAFFGRRRAGRSRRGLPLWEVDAYRRAVRLAWGATTRLYPFGRARAGQRRALWLEIAVSREFVGGQTRPEEAVAIADSSVTLTLEAVVRPRRALVRLTLLRGDTASAPKVLDMVPDTPGRPVTFVLGRRQSRTVEVALTLPKPFR